MPSPKDTRNDRQFEKLPSKWIFVLCEALELALGEKTYRRDRPDVSGTLESLRC
jgi:hypothetical protein